MFVWLTAPLQQAGLRRAVSVLCAAVLIAFTFIHATHHCALAAEAPVQVEHTAHHGSSDGPDNAPEASHCCNCSTAAMIVVDAAQLTAAPAPRVETAVWRAPHPHIPPADIRPPIA